MTKSQDKLRGRIVQLLQERGAMSRAELARALLVSRATMSGAVAALASGGLIEEAEDVPRAAAGGVGRPGARVALKASGEYLVGVDFGRAGVNVAIADLRYRIIQDRALEFDIDAPAQEALNLAASSVEDLIVATGIDRRQIRAVGLGVPGPVDATTGRLHAGSILASWVGADIPGELSRMLGLPTYIDNDANLAALAESTFGAAAGVNVALYVLLSMGVGLGIVINGRVFRGASGIAGELGHVVIDELGPVCRCGNRGCLEAAVSINTLARSLRSSHGGISPAEMLRCAAAGDLGAGRVVADAGMMVGRLVGALCNYFNPELVLVGGELMRAGDILLTPLRDAVRRFSIARANEHVRIMPGALGERAELLGALLFAAEKARAARAAGPSTTAGRHRARALEGTA